MAIQVDHSILPELAPRLFQQFHRRRPKNLVIYTLDYKRDGSVYTLVGVWHKKCFVSVDEIHEEEVRAMNRYIRARHQPDPGHPPDPGTMANMEKAKELVLLLNVAESRRFGRLPISAWPEWAQRDLHLLFDALQQVHFQAIASTETKKPCPTSKRSSTSH